MRILHGVICACIYQDLSCSAISTTYLPWWRAISSSRLSRMTHHGLPPLLNVFYSSAVFFCTSSQATSRKPPTRPRCSKNALAVLNLSMPAGSSQKRSARNVATRVNPASASEASQRRQPVRIMIDAPSSSAITSAANNGAGDRPKWFISPIAP